MGLLQNLFGKGGEPEPIVLPIAPETNAQSILAAPRWSKPVPDPGSHEVLAALIIAMFNRDDAQFESLVTQNGDLIEKNFKAWIKNPGPVERSLPPGAKWGSVMMEIGNILQQAFGFPNLLGSFTIPESDDVIVRLAGLATSAREARKSGSPDDALGLLSHVTRELGAQKGNRARAFESVVQTEIGDCQLMMGERNKALESYENALMLARKAGFQPGIDASTANLRVVRPA